MPYIGWIALVCYSDLPNNSQRGAMQWTKETGVFQTNYSTNLYNTDSVIGETKYCASSKHSIANEWKLVMVDMEIAFLKAERLAKSCNNIYWYETVTQQLLHSYICSAFCLAIECSDCVMSLPYCQHVTSRYAHKVGSYQSTAGSEVEV